MGFTDVDQLAFAELESNGNFCGSLEFGDIAIHAVKFSCSAMQFRHTYVAHLVIYGSMFYIQ